MSWLKSLGKVATGALKSPMLKGAMSIGKMVPGLGTVLAGADLAMTAYDAFAPKGGDASAGGLPALPPPPGFGGNSMRGPGGALQMPGFGASTSAGAGAHTLDDRYLRVCYRAPRGYVVMWDGGHHGVGKPFPVLKRDAIHMRYADGSRVFHPHHKPPISVGKWHALKKAHSTVKSLEKVNKMARHVLGASHGLRVKPQHHNLLPRPKKK